MYEVIELTNSYRRTFDLLNPSQESTTVVDEEDQKLRSSEENDSNSKM